MTAYVRRPMLAKRAWQYRIVGAVLALVLLHRTGLEQNARRHVMSFDYMSNPAIIQLHCK